jgi:hypothetical protein
MRDDGLLDGADELPLRLLLLLFFPAAGATEEGAAAGVATDRRGGGWLAATGMGMGATIWFGPCIPPPLFAVNALI